MRELSDEEFETYSRQIALADIGYKGQLKLRNAKVCLVGLGGLGAPTALKLTSMGVGYLRLVDRDVVSRSDLHRQYLYDVDSLWQAKVEAGAKRLKRLNPDVDLDPVASPLNSANAEDVVKGVDLVVDGLDSIETRYILNRACFKLGLPYVFGAAIELQGTVSTLIPGETPCLECFYPELRDKQLPKCAVVGVHPSITGIISSLQVVEAIRLMVGSKPHLAGKLLFIDLRSMSFDELEISPSPDCAVCGEKPSRLPRLIAEEFFEETCSRDGRRVFIVTPKGKVDLDLKSLCSVLKREGLPVRVKGHYSVAFDYKEGLRICILKSGTMIAQVPPRTERISRSEIIKIYRGLLKEKLNVKSTLLS